MIPNSLSLLDGLSLILFSIVLVRVDNPLNENLDEMTVSKSVVTRVHFTTIYEFITFPNSIAVKFLFGDYNSVD